VHVEETEVPDDPRDVTPDKETCDMLYLIAKKMVPILKEHEVEEKRACIPPHSDDLLPVMGEIPGVEGAYICSGMNSCIMAVC
jgi:glycine/D-amino acid oxidase-like deaminating enzyme